MRIATGIAVLASPLLPFATPIGPSRAFGGENLTTERMLAECIQGGARATDGETPVAGKWAILPQVGYSPDRGANAGIKFTDRDATPARLTIDLDGSYAVKRQQHAGLTVVAPHLFEDKLILALEGDYLFDPTKEFFGLGNNSVGPDPLSTHEHRSLSLLGTIAALPHPRVTLALTAGFSDTRIRRGRLEDDTPSTLDAFPTLAGTGGGRANPLAFSLVFNNREDIT
ncbi:MAG: hypothetical protein ACREQQ_03510, partial [Candidatus Binatia bacterium]